MSEFQLPGSVKLLIHVCKQPGLPWRGGLRCGVSLWGDPRLLPVLVMGEGYRLCVLPWEPVLGSFCGAESHGSLLNGGA